MIKLNIKHTKINASLDDCCNCIDSISLQNSLIKNGGTVSGAAGYYPNSVSQTVSASDVTSGARQTM